MQVPSRKRRHSSHDGDDVQKQQRISDRIFRHIDVQAMLVVQKKRLVQCPKGISDRERHPERPRSKGILYCIAYGEPGREKQEEEITDGAPGKQEGVRSCNKWKNGPDDDDANQQCWPGKKLQPPPRSSQNRSITIP